MFKNNKNLLMKKILHTLTVLLLIGYASETNAQLDCSNGRYSTPLFQGNLTITDDITYGSNIQPTFFDPNATQTLNLDFYEPTGDTETARPLIIFAFGGAFVAGSKDSPDIVALCNNFAEHGYVTASIDYRLTSDLVLNGNPANATKAVLKATHDMRAAVRFFKKDAATTNTYKIDTTNIFVAGVSAGGFAALHLAYLDKMSEIPTIIASDVPALGGIEGLSGNPGYSSDVAGVINLCGALGDDSWIEAGDVPVVSVHGDNDNVVPYGSAQITLFGINLDVDGSGSIHPAADAVNVHNDLLTFQGQDHTPFVSSNDYMDSTFQFTKDFLYPLICNGPVGIEENEKQVTSVAFPNPTSNVATITFSTNISNKNQITFFDITGKEVEIENTILDKNSIRINKNNTLTGIYFYQLKNTSGMPMTTDKIVFE